MDRRALILGGGGVTGIAWETGLIAGLAGLGIDLAAADVIIGTSAGSLAGTGLASGQEPESLYQAQLAPPAPEPAARMGWGVTGRLVRVMSTSRDGRGRGRGSATGRCPRAPCPRPACARYSKAAGLAAAGARVVLVRPDRAAVHAIGHNVLDLSRRAAAATAGRAQATVETAAVRAVRRADGGPAAS